MVARTFQVLLSRRSSVEAALVNLAKRADRKGLPPLTWTWGKATSEKERVPHPDFGETVEHFAMIARIPLTLTGETPKYQGWTFLAALTHIDGENIVRAVPEATIPAEYRSKGPVCDHCQYTRRRNETYLVQHDNGTIKQVGSTCIGDFLGSDDALKIAAHATMLAEACGIGEGGCEGMGGGGDICLSEYLGYVAWCVRKEGWVSRTQIREQGREGTATADRAMAYLHDPKARELNEVELTAEDCDTAKNAEAWAEALTDEEVNASKGDYLHNLRVIARSGIVSHKSTGLAGSMIVAYQRAIGRARERAERAARPTLDAYLGTVGKRETWTVTLDFVTGYETAYGYTTLLKFRTDEGATLVWKASSTDLGRSDVGKKYSLTGTVKKHDLYQGAKQTIVSRCKVSEVS